MCTEAAELFFFSVYFFLQLLKQIIDYSPGLVTISILPLFLLFFSYKMKSVMSDETLIMHVCPQNILDCPRWREGEKDGTALYWESRGRLLASRPSTPDSFLLDAPRDMLPSLIWEHPWLVISKVFRFKKIVKIEQTIQYPIFFFLRYIDYYFYC